MTATMPEPVIGGNVYPKYTTRNPVARLLVGGFMASLQSFVERSGVREIHEVGCGEGFLTTALARGGYEVRGSDISAEAVAGARRRAADLGLAVPFRVASLYDLAAPEDAAELVVCCEVLEHVPDPERALRTLAGLARPNLILSVPHEPLWRALNVLRGRYWYDLGNTPGHVQHWSRIGFRRLVQAHFDVVESRTPPPWIMLLCRAR